MARRTTAVLIGLAVLVLVGCSSTPPAPATEAAAPTTSARSTIAVSTDPLAGFPPRDRAFVTAMNAEGFSVGTTDQEAARLGQLVCAEIRSGSSPKEVQSVLTGALTAEEAARVFTLAHSTMCSEVALPDPNSFGEGTYEVGVDIKPGTYRSPGGTGCYWARLAKNQQDIIDNNLSDGPSVFTVQESDGYVELNRCTWTKSG